MPLISTGSTAIEFGATLRIGYRLNGSTGPFTYLSYFPGYNELPYTFTIPTAGTWELEYSQICPSCSGSKYSLPQNVVVTVV